MGEFKEAKELLSIGEAAELLNVSRPTFAKIRKESDLDSIAVVIGRRVRFPKNKLIEKLSETVVKEVVAKGGPPPKKLCIFSDPNIVNLGLDGDEIDLTEITVVDPFGTLSLLTLLVNKSRAGKKIHLKIDDSITCRHLRQIFFFDMLQMYAPNVSWDKDVLRGDKYEAPESLLPITVVKFKGAERTTVQKLVDLLGVHGFSADRSGFIGGILGELADNCMTHSHSLVSKRMCFLQAQRHSFGEYSHCLVVAIADVGQGIADSLRRNPKHENLSDEEAVLSAFKHKFSSWGDEAKRGKGLTDTLGISMGNKGLLRVASGEYDYRFNYLESRKGDSFTKCDPPLVKTNGTRIGIVYIDHDFTKVSRSDVSSYIDKVLETL